ncbi:proline iminopeptidase-family hydrolase [Ferruginibacter albus]|uniref:proline iminopeptidase-family hydrolase n=1 Tax=Ferruginibacter albus TaxID=2875540 RepID=UPI001CC75468|nr:proline iminopeptidase-family hydrolase [Ferruginibacter albus]UAY51462.1 proline iminopeptidase-family hydrolase [Ferruginibacter albus]
MKKLFTYFFLLVLAGCTSQKALTPGEGYINVKGGKVWYNIVGQGKKPPILLLHGGPGSNSNYLSPFTALSKDRSVIFLDQLGSGNSDKISDTSLMRIENYVDELIQVQKKLKLKKYYLYGHSWGTMLGIDYYLKHPKGIKAIIFNSPLFSTDCWMKDADTLISTLPSNIEAAIRTNEKNKTYNTLSYQNAVSLYYKKFLRTQPDTAPTPYSYFAEDIYEYMWGPSEFTCTGNLKNYNRLADLHTIKVPTLLICGEHDEARPTTVRYYQSLIPNAQFIEIKNSGHSTMRDNPKDNIIAVEQFLSGLENDH